jgi:hypothetical protein
LHEDQSNFAYKMYTFEYCHFVFSWLCWWTECWSDDGNGIIRRARSQVFCYGPLRFKIYACFLLRFPFIIMLENDWKVVTALSCFAHCCIPNQNKEHIPTKSNS